MVKRKKNWKVLCIGLTACFSFYVQACFSQSVQTFTNKKDILIGEQVQLKIKAVPAPGQHQLYQWFSLPDSIPHFDIVETGKVDTINYKDNSKVFEQTIILTSFDSGKWVFPSLPIVLSSETGQKLQTDSFVVNVSYSPPDSTNQLRDIKPIINVTVTDYTWYYIIGGIVLLLLIIVLIYLYRKKNKKAKPEKALSKLSPYEEAMQEISKLSAYNLQHTEEVKMYHTKLSDIFKRYLGRKQNKDLSNKTTGDLLVRMAENSMASGNVSNLATALRCADAVKFAKYLPSITESEDSMIKIKETINLLEQQTITNKP